MNLLEHRIVEIVLEKPFKADWTKRHKDKFVEVEMIVDVYGGLSSVRRILTVDRWEEIKEKGFYLA